MKHLKLNNRTTNLIFSQLSQKSPPAFSLARSRFYWGLTKPYGIGQPYRVGYGGKPNAIGLDVSIGLNKPESYRILTDLIASNPIGLAKVADQML